MKVIIAFTIVGLFGLAILVTFVAPFVVMFGWAAVLGTLGILAAVGAFFWAIDTLMKWDDERCRGKRK